MIIRFDSKKDWLEWRKGGIGGSDIATIMGHNPYKTPYQLWEEKCGYRETFETPAMAYGTLKEPVARQWLNEKRSFNLESGICLQDDSNPIFRASLDGYQEEGRIVCEIKCPVNEDTIARARDKEIPNYWLDQILWNMSLIEGSQGLFAVWDDLAQEAIYFSVPYFPELVEEMRANALEFWQHVVSGTPPSLSEADYEEIDNQECILALDDYNKLSRRIKIDEEFKEAVKEKILSFGNGKSFRCGKYKVKKMPGRVTYDMEAMKADGIDIEKYVKNKVEYFMILCPRENR